MVLFLSISSSALTWSTRPSVGVDALPRYYHLGSFNYRDMNARDIGRIAAVILSNIMPDNISGDNWVVEKRLKLFLFLKLRGFDIMFDNNCREYTWYWLYSSSEREKILNYKWLRQEGLIIANWDFLSMERVCGFQNWNLIWGFLCWVKFTVRYFLINLQSDFVGIVLLHFCCSVGLLHVCGASFLENTAGGLLLNEDNFICDF